MHIPTFIFWWRLVNIDTHVNMATFGSLLQASNSHQYHYTHSRPVSGAAASGSSPKRLTANKRRVARPGKHPRPSVQSRFVPIRKRHLN